MNWKRAFIASLAAVPVILLLAWGMTRDPKEIPSPMPGRDAPTFSLEVFAPGQPPLARPVGDTVRLAAMRGKVVVLNFWASWCLACRDEHTTLSEVARRYDGKPVQFLGVLYNDAPKNGTEWIAEMGGQTYPSVNDPGARTAIDYGLYGVPETFFLDASGRVAYKHTGPVSDAVVSRVVDSLIAAGAGPGATGAATGAMPAKGLP
jgi:cytochrome c biogenesis protein CcmG/thiol:disulfide interchange protein DsbE